jgi:hypothetical protein
MVKTFFGNIRKPAWFVDYSRFFMIEAPCSPAEAGREMRSLCGSGWIQITIQLETPETVLAR